MTAMEILYYFSLASISISAFVGAAAGIVHYHKRQINRLRNPK